MPYCHIGLEKEILIFKSLNYFGNTKHADAVLFLLCTALHRSTPNTEWLIDFGA
jgi:hypothetical protein